MSSAQAHDKLVGRTVGEFVLRDRIGEGGFGVVYRATQPALDREAAVKLLHTRLGTATAATERFLREAKLASKLDHPYAAHIYAFGAEPDGTLWIAMELVRGTPLDQILRIQGPIPLERFVPLLDRICEVVHTAHEQGIVHRDLKPANVMVLSRAGRLLPKLLDLGIAKGLVGSTGMSTSDTLQLDASANPRIPARAPTDAGFAKTLDTLPPTPAIANVGLTQRGAVMGSPPYMAPEQWLDAGMVDSRTDLYALGILAYEALTGKPPFMGTTITAIALAHASDDPAPLGPRFPAALDGVFARALAKEADGRYPDALAFATAFRAAAGISSESVRLPAIDPVRRAAAVTTAPQPIAEAVAAIEAARNAHQARDAILALVKTVTRYLGLLALACRSRVNFGDDGPGVAETMRMLYRRSLADKEWVDLTRELTRTWIDRRDAYPIPELVDAFHDPRVSAIQHLEALTALRDADAIAEDRLVGLLDRAVGHTSKLLDAIAFLNEYALVVTAAGGVAERWMGVRRTQRTTTAVRGKGLAAGIAALLDKDGVPVLTLAPLVQVVAPTPGAPLDLFLFEGRDSRGAKLVTLPAGFEHHDEGLWDWFRAQLKGSLDHTEAAGAEESPPYRGLSAFSAQDGAMFFGREKLVDAFANRLRVQPLLAVVGRSGAGKSSFVQAGVIPALPDGWRTVVLRPGPSPIGTLLARLAQLEIATDGLREAIARDRNALGDVLRKYGPIVLVIDQLEELFTLCQDVEERRQFAEAVANAARTTDDPVRVIFTLRDDFLLRTEQVSALRNRIGQGLQLLSVPLVDDLLRILVEPARRVGYEFEDPELPLEMVKEVADQPGALALLSFTAAKLWELRDRHFKQLTRTAYRSLGGVGGALARHAETTLDGMVPEERRLTREAFRHLVTTANTRAVLERTELRQLLGNTENADVVMEKLIGARLLVASENETGAETIEIIHEALLVAWPRLVEWRHEDADGKRFREQLRAAAKQWDDRDRPKGLLWRGDALADYTRWRSRHEGVLADVEQAFARASVGDAARARRTLRAVLAIVVAVLVAGVVTLTTLNARIKVQRQRAEEGAEEVRRSLATQYEDQGRLALLQGDQIRAMLYFNEAFQSGADDPALQFLTSRAARSFDDLVAVFDPRAGGIQRQAAFLTPDGARAIAAYEDGTVRGWDVSKQQQLYVLPDHQRTDGSLRISADGTLAVDGRRDRVVRIWRVDTGEIIRLVPQDSEPHRIELSPDASRVVTIDADGHGRLWDIAAGKLVAELPMDGPMWTAGFSPDSRALATGGYNVARIWDARTGTLEQTIKGHTDLVWTTAFSPDATTLLTTSSDKLAKLWDARTGAAQHTISVHTDTVEHGVFNPDGTIVVTTGLEGTAHVWNPATTQLIATLPLRNRISDLAFAANNVLATCGGDGDVAMWDLPSGISLATFAGHGGEVNSISIDGSGSHMLTGGRDGTMRLWNAHPQSAVIQLRSGHGSVSAVAYFGATQVLSAHEANSIDRWDLSTRALLQSYRAEEASTSFFATSASPDGRFVAAAGSDRAVYLWDASTGRLLHRIAQPADVYTVAFAPDGSLAWPTDHAVVIWDLDANRERRRIASDDVLVSARFDVTGKQLVTAAPSGTVQVWDVATGRAIHTLRRPEANAEDASFSHDGRRIAVARVDSDVEIWDAQSGVLLATLSGHIGAVLSVEFSPDDRFLLTTSVDKTGRIWDASTYRLLERVDSRAGAFGRAAFGPDGNTVATSGEDGVVRVWNVHAARWTPAATTRFARCRLPKQLVEGRIVPHQVPADCP